MNKAFFILAALGCLSNGFAASIETRATVHRDFPRPLSLQFLPDWGDQVWMRDTPGAIPRLGVEGGPGTPGVYGVLAQFAYCKINGELIWSDYKSGFYAPMVLKGGHSSHEGRIPPASLRFSKNILECRFRALRLGIAMDSPPVATPEDFTFEFILRNPGPILLPRAQIRKVPRSADFQLFDDFKRQILDFAGTLGPLELSLKELDPETISNLEATRQEVAALQKELKQLQDEDLSTEELSDKLESLKAITFTELAPQELEKLTPELHEIAQTVATFKSEIEQVRNQVKAEIAETQTQLTKLEKAFDLSDITNSEQEIQALYDRFGAQEVSLPVSVIPELVSREELFNESQNVYSEMAAQTLRRLEAAFQRGDRREFSVLSDAWAKTQKVLAQTHLQAGSAISTKEQRAFENATREVVTYLNGKVDEYGFFKDLPIYPEVKEAIRATISRYDAARARRLRDALNEWSKEEAASAENKLIQETILALAAGYQAAGESDDKTVLTKLDSISDETETVARVGFRLAVTFSPLNDYVDFCELTLGLDGCLPGARVLSTGERAISGAGLLFGSGQFWRGLAKFFPGRQIAPISETTLQIIEAIRVAQGKIPVKIAPEVLEEVQRLARFDLDAALYAMSVRALPEKIGTYVRSGAKLSTKDARWGKQFQPGRWVEHFEKHGREAAVLSKTPEEYLSKARAHIGSKEPHIIRASRSKDGVLASVILNEKTMEIAFVDADGIITSYHEVDRLRRIKNLIAREFTLPFAD